MQSFAAAIRFRRPRLLQACLASFLAAGSLAPRIAVAGDDAGDEQRDGRTSAERRRVEQLGLGRASTVHRLIREGPTTAQLRSAGGDERPATLLFPIPGARIGRGHGSGTNGYHEALDIIADEGTVILAAESGLVVYTGDELSGFGNLAVILHPGGWLTYYAHLSAYLVRPGQKVERGQRVARVGNTGISRGPHLHFVLWMEGDQIDPYPFFRPAPGVPRSGPLPFTGHRVRARETWAGIAERYGVTASELREANHLPADADLHVGWQLIVPKRLESPPEDEEPDPGSPDEGTYVVQAGDTLSEIAERFSIPLDDLARWNDLADPSRIRSDMVLVLNGEDSAEDAAAEGEGDEPAERGPAAGASSTADSSPSEPRASASVPMAGADEEDDPPAPAPDEPAAAAGDLHVVREGETVSEIAAALGLHVRDLLQANPDLDPDRVHPGQELRIPDVGGGPDNERVEEDGGRERVLTTAIEVREGDSLWSLARRWRTSVRTLRDLNPDVGDGTRIRPGQRLLVPRPER
ncbi:MAG: LysM peptidoglycan-binding domain-containing protein [Deltaproteobacteria bacterium]|nr:LysM peptidoglycan-binding domain-containing protein [Deltaproteobacteria bacterium]